jgi:hypothetical protein
MTGQVDSREISGIRLGLEITVATGGHHLMKNQLTGGCSKELSASSFEQIIFISMFETPIWPGRSFSKGFFERIYLVSLFPNPHRQS